MRLVLTLLFVMLLLPALQAVAEGGDAIPGEFGGCSPPESPAIPDGEKVDADEIKHTVSVVKTYLKQGENYIVCLTELENSWSDEATKDQRKELIHNHNAMVDAMQAAAERFNAELAKYRAQEQ